MYLVSFRPAWAGRQSDLVSSVCAHTHRFHSNLHIIQIQLAPIVQTIFLFKPYLFTFCIWVLCLNIHLYAVCVPGICGGQRRMELELQKVVSCHVGAGTLT